MSAKSVELNGVGYRWPSRPVVVVCIDGGDPAYFDRAIADGIVPNVARFIEEGFGAVANAVVPTFTCPNNISIATVSPPSTHGISGNYYLDPDTGEEVVMTGPELMRSSTLFEKFSVAGAKVIAITAKDKLRQQLGKGMDIAGGAICFSSQYADRCTMEENGIEDVLDFVGRPLPDMYSADLSLFVLDAGIRFMEQARKPDIMYLSLTDFIQHKYAPGEGEADAFYKDLDERFGRLAALGAVVGLTADHGMNDKSKADGTPNVIWLQDLLDEKFGASSTTVICPITDAFVGHHGALGGFVRVYCTGAVTPESVIEFAAAIPGIESVHDKQAAAAEFDLPPDREGDVVVISDAGTCIGASAANHDLSGLEGHRLRTHGGVSERRVPFIISAPLNETYRARAAGGVVNNYEIFDYAINGVEVSADAPENSGATS